MIGVGVTGDPKWIDRVNPLCNADLIIYNNDQTTIAKDKNKLIKELYEAGCDYIFLFDDDTFPIKAGWEQFFIDAHLRTGIEHFNLCTPRTNTLEVVKDAVSLYSTGTGCMLFLTRKCIEITGYFNPNYGKYGYEHCAYSLRIHKAGLAPAWYVTVNGWEEYVYSWDLAGQSQHGYSKLPARTEEERQSLINANEFEWQREQFSEKIYYSYDS